MNLQIHFKEMASTEAIKDHITDRAEKLRRFIDEGELIKVIVGAERHHQYCEIFWHDRDQKKDFFAKNDGEHLYSQIDDAFLTIEKQIHKAHDKRVSKTKHEKAGLKRSVSM